MASSAPIYTLLVLTCLLATSYASTVDCGKFQAAVTGCTSYAQGHAGSLQQCCSDLHSIGYVYRTLPGRQDSCECFKHIAQTVPGLKSDLLVDFPGKCGATLPYTISTTTDCTKVQ